MQSYLTHLFPEEHWNYRSFTRKLRCLIPQMDDFELKKKKKQNEPCSVSSLIKWVVFYCSSNQEKGQKVKDNFHFFSLLQCNLVSERETKEPSVHDLLLSYLMLQSLICHMHNKTLAKSPFQKAVRPQPIILVVCCHKLPIISPGL